MKIKYFIIVIVSILLLTILAGFWYIIDLNNMLYTNLHQKENISLVQFRDINNAVIEYEHCVVELLYSNDATSIKKVDEKLKIINKEIGVLKNIDYTQNDDKLSKHAQALAIKIEKNNTIFQNIIVEFRRKEIPLNQDLQKEFRIAYQNHTIEIKAHLFDELYGMYVQAIKTNTKIDSLKSDLYNDMLDLKSIASAEIQTTQNNTNTPRISISENVDYIPNIVFYVGAGIFIFTVTIVVLFIMFEKRANSKITARGEQYKALVNNIPGITYRCFQENSWKMEYISEEIYHVSGFPPSDFINNQVRSYSSIIHPDDIEMVEKIVFEGLEMMKPFTMEYRILHKNGEYRWVYEKGRGVYDTEKKLTYIDGVILDITERQLAQNAVRISEEKYRGLVESSSDWIWEIDIEGKYCYSSPQVEMILGYTVEEVYEKTPFDFMSEAEAERVQTIFQKLVQKGQAVTMFENVNYHKEGHEVVLETSGLPMFDNNGTVIGYRGIDRNITKRKIAEEKILQLNQDLELKVMARTAELEGVNQELNDFAYIVSHDLKAPLRGISQLSSWLQSDYIDVIGEEGREVLDLLAARVLRMSHMIDGVLSYSRVGKDHNSEELTDFNELIGNIIDSLPVSETITISIDSVLPSLVIDAIRIEQVFQNLISNAIKYMDKANGIVTIEYEDQTEKNLFKICDNGPGIEEKYHDKIFEVFQTLQSSDEIDSTGIGLTTVKKIIKFYEGEIWVESELGKGSKFCFTLPKREGDA